ncbi:MULTISPECIES: PKD domain-containing protein [Colwellia]|nr:MULTISPECIES: hypothetical protein [Colwellia]
MVSAGVDAVYNEKDNIFLYGEASDIDGTVVSTSWSQLEGPNVTITNDTSLKAEFVAPITQETKVLAFKLSVTDNLGAKSSSTVNITVNPENPVNEPPLVSVGSDFEVNEESTVTLSGEVSDTDGEVLSTYWKQLEGMSVELDDASSVNTTFIAPVLSLEEGAQILVFELTVTDNLDAVNTDSISITINPINEPPSVSAGSDFEDNEGNVVILYGEVSDTDGEIVSTSWKQLEGPSVELYYALSVNPTFLAPPLPLKEAQILVFELTATDNLGAVNTDSISIIINPLNEAPIANAGMDKIQEPNTEVTLDCSESYDPEGFELSVSWLQISGSYITLGDNSSCLITFDLPNTEDDFEFYLTVTDDKGESSSDTISITSTILPLLTLDNFEYQGGFRLSAARYGVSNYSKLDYSPAVIALSESKTSLFVVSHDYEQGIAEFEIPEIVNTTVISEMNVGSNVLQSFEAFYGNARDVTGIDENFRLTGMQLINSKLVVNYINWYDGDMSETDTTVVFQDPSNLATSPIVGPFQLGGAAHTAGWMTPIPEHWKDKLNGSYISGWSGGSINGRLSIGPPAFLLNPETDLVNKTSGGAVPTIPVLDFNIEHKLYDTSVYTYEESLLQPVFNNTYDGKNNLWTVLSEATYGFIVPNTNTYVTLGHSAGHESGIGYKITQDTGRVCGGYCPPIAADKYNYVWFWKVSDLVKVQNGEMLSYDVRPYSHAVFGTIGSNGELMGGAFDPESMTLYVALKKGDNIAPYARPPLFLKYKINVE